MADAQLVLVDEAGHNPQDEPGQVMAVLRPFLAVSEIPTRSGEDEALPEMQNRPSQTWFVNVLTPASRRDAGHELILSAWEEILSDLKQRSDAMPLVKPWGGHQPGAPVSITPGAGPASPAGASRGWS